MLQRGSYSADFQVVFVDLSGYLIKESVYQFDWSEHVVDIQTKRMSRVKTRVVTDYQLLRVRSLGVY